MREIQLLGVTPAQVPSATHKRFTRELRRTLLLCLREEQLLNEAQVQHMDKKQR